MKPIQIDKTTVETHGTQGSVAFGIKASGLHHILGILRNQLYSDKILAVVREYSCNAIDAHTQAGCADRAIQVTLPNTMNPNFKVRDFGDALTDTEISEVYAFYGESTKRNSNDQIGMLGIGSKSAFAYGDNFVIHSFIDGKKHIYNAYIDPSQLGQITKLAVEDTDEENGIEIVVPVKKDDHGEFANRAGQLFRWFKVKPKVTGSQIDLGGERKVIFSGDGWEWVEVKDAPTYGYGSHSGEATVVMGNIGYPINSASLNLNDDDSDLDTLLSRELVIHAKIGDVEISASREKLQYTDYTRKNLIAKLKNLKKQLLKTINKEFADAPSLFAAKCIYGEVFDYGSPLYRMRSLVTDDLQWNGIKIEGDDFVTYNQKNEENVEVHHLVKTRGYTGKLKFEAISRINCKKNVQIIENDIGHRMGVMGRLLPLALNEGKKVYLINYKNAAAKKEFKKEQGFDAPTTKLSTLPKYKLSEFEGYGSNGSGASYDKNPKYSAKGFSFNFKHDGRAYDRKKSSWWEQADIDLSKGGLYAVIEQFEIQTDGKYKTRCYGGGNMNPHILKNLKENLGKLGIKMPKVYGFKVAAKKKIDKVKADSKWTNVFDWIKSELEKALEAKGLVQVYADVRAYKKWNSESRANSVQLANFFEEKKVCYEHFVYADSPMKSFIKQVKTMAHLDKEEAINAFIEMGDSFGVAQLEDMGVKKPTHDLDEISKQVMDKYSMLEHLEFGWNKSDTMKDDIINYVNVIDVCDAAKKD